MNLAAWVLVGGAAGILVGLLFGDDCAILSPIGFAYVGLLQAAVYPYLICSLLHGLGSLEPGKAWRLFKCGWIFYVAAWIVTFATLAALARAIPEVNPAVIAETAATPHSVSSLLGLLIPTDLFTALTQNYVPAVVIFCIFYGVAMQTLKDKQALLSMLETIRLASLRFWNWIVRLAPIGVFALFAVTAGTTALHDLVNMGLYLALFMIGAGILSFWILPGLITGLAPVGHREVIRELRAALAIAAVTTLSVAALPFVTEATRRIADRCGIGEPECDDIIRTNLSVAYPLGQLGNFFVYLFLVFAAYYFKAPLEGRNEALLPLMTLLSGFGSPTSAVNAVAFLSAWLPLPRGTPELYVELQTITRYGQVIASVMAFAFLSVLVTLAYYGKLRLRPGRLVASILLPGLVLGALAWTGHQAHRRLAPATTNYGAFTLDPLVTRGVQATIYRSEADYEKSPARLHHALRLHEDRRGHLDTRAGGRARPLPSRHHRSGAQGRGQSLSPHVPDAAPLRRDGALRQLLAGSPQGRRHACAGDELLATRPAADAGHAALERSARRPALEFLSSARADSSVGCGARDDRVPSSGGGVRSCCVTRSPDSPPCGRRAGRGGPTPPERTPPPAATRPVTRAALDLGRRGTAARDLRKEIDLAVGLDRLEERVLVDLAIDGHGDAFIQMRAEGWMQLGELLEELLHGRRRELELGDAPRKLREVPHQHHARHARPRPCGGPSP